jgi:hypothetical protein
MCIMLTYLLWGLVTTFFFDTALKGTENEFNNFERGACFLLWPLVIVMFFYWYIKNNF